MKKEDWFLIVDKTAEKTFQDLHGIVGIRNYEDDIRRMVEIVRDDMKYEALEELTFSLVYPFAYVKLKFNELDYEDLLNTPEPHDWYDDQRERWNTVKIHFLANCLVFYKTFYPDDKI